MIPTSKEIIKRCTNSKWMQDHPEFVERLEAAIIKFTKSHVTAALKSVHAQHQLSMEDVEFTLDAYDLNNIK